MTERVSTAQIEAAKRVDLVPLVSQRVKLKRKGTSNVYWGLCPFHTDRSPSFKAQREFFKCFACGARGDIFGWLKQTKGYSFIDSVLWLNGEATAQIGKMEAGAAIPQVSTIAGQDGEGRSRTELARYLWVRRRSPLSSPVGAYLRARGYSGPIPATIGFLPPSEKYPDPTMIAAFGFASEPEPGVIAIRDADVRAIHLTRLQAEGRDRLRTPDAKIMIGAVKGSPIVIARPNDLLGLAITEGIEDALSVHEATGLGGWAAGSASFMPALVDAVPDYIESVSIMAHPDEAGRHGASLLVSNLAARHISASMVLLGGVAA